MKVALERLREATRGTQFEGDLFLVGGAVRDELLGYEPGSDLDLVTRGPAPELAELLWRQGASSIPPVIYARFGTAMVRVEGVDIELVTARKESYNPESRKPNVEPASYLEDAQRRDFTVNALHKDLFTGEVRDPLGTGLPDLRHGILRTPLDPALTFHDDPLRMLRAVRFRWKLDFQPADGLYEAIRTEAHRLDIVSAERVRDEVNKMLRLATASDCFRDLLSLGLLERFAPEFLPMVDCEQGKYHHKDVWEHSLLVLDRVGHDDVLLSWAALLHDVGKPPTRTVDANGDTRFFSHDSVGADMARGLLRRLKFSEKDVDQVASLVKNHMRLGTSPVFTPTAARRLVRDMGDLVPDLLQLVEADVASLKPGVIVRHMKLDLIREQIEAVKVTQPKSGFECPISGERIMELTGLNPGPEVGKVKSAITEAVLEGRIAPGDVDAAEVMALAHRGAETQSSE